MEEVRVVTLTYDEAIIALFAILFWTLHSLMGGKK